MGHCIHGSQGFWAGMETDRLPVKDQGTASLQTLAVTVAAVLLLTAFMFNYCTDGESSDFQLVKHSSSPDPC